MGVLISVRLADIVRQQMMKRKEVIKNGQINGSWSRRTQSASIKAGRNR